MAGLIGSVAIALYTDTLTGIRCLTNGYTQISTNCPNQTLQGAGSKTIIVSVNETYFLYGSVGMSPIYTIYANANAHVVITRIA